MSAETDLRETEDGYQLLFHANPAPMWVYDTASLRFLAVNDAAVACYGYTREEFLDMTIADIRRPEELGRLRENIAQMGSGPDRSEGWAHVTKSGEERLVEVTSRAVYFQGNHARLVLVRDITEQRRAEHDRDAVTESLQMILNSAAEGIYGLDVRGHCTFVNASAVQALGFRADELLGRHMHTLVHHHRADGSEYPVDACPITMAILGGRGILRETDLLWRRDGTSFPVEYRAEPIVREGTVIGAVVSFVDITHRRAAEMRLRTDAERLAATDPLTGVGNRRHARTLLQVTAPGDALVMLDLDHFKRVNDTEGHAAGDALLVRVAAFLRSSLRDSDLFARYGGEEFLLVLRAGTDPLSVVERLQAAWRDTWSQVTFSAGIAVRRGPEPPEMTLARADAALYRAKDAGRDRAELAV